MPQRKRKPREHAPATRRPSIGPPNRAEFEWAVAQHRTGHVHAALGAYRRLLAVRKDDPKLLHLLGLALAQSGRAEEGIPLIRRAVQLGPGVAEFRANLAAVYGGLGRHEEAATELREVLELQPGDLHALNNLGASLEHLEQFDESVNVLSEVVTRKPEFGLAWANLSNALRRSGRIAQALDSARRTVALSANLEQGWFALGAALQEQGGPDLLHEQVHCFRRAIALKGDLAGAHACLGLCLLLQGKMDEGWREYEWRRDPQLAAGASASWCLASSTGRPAIDLAGRTIMITGEGGMGNIIQFARYVPIVARWAREVTVTCHAPLVPLLKRVKGIGHVIAHEDPPPEGDLHCPMMSLPAMLGPVLPDVPASVPYIEIEEDLVARWRAVIAEASCSTAAPGCDSSKARIPGQEMSSVRLRRTTAEGGCATSQDTAEGGRATSQDTVEGGCATILRVGVCWRGSQSVAAMRDRSIPVECLKPLAIEGVSLINLQHGVDPPDQPAMITLPGMGPREMQLLDVAAVIKNLDVVITCDTSIAHLAGALGIETWVALKHNADWRWLLERGDTPWYPTMRLLRQERAGDWDGVIERMAAALRERVQASRDGVGATQRDAAAVPAQTKAGLETGPRQTHRAGPSLLESLDRELQELETCRHELARERLRLIASTLSDDADAEHVGLAKGSKVALGRVHTPEISATRSGAASM